MRAWHEGVEAHLPEFARRWPELAQMAHPFAEGERTGEWHATPRCPRAAANGAQILMTIPESATLGGWMIECRGCLEHLTSHLSESREILHTLTLVRNLEEDTRGPLALAERGEMVTRTMSALSTRRYGTNPQLDEIIDSALPLLREKLREKVEIPLEVDRYWQALSALGEEPERGSEKQYTGSEAQYAAHLLGEETGKEWVENRDEGERYLYLAPVWHVRIPTSRKGKWHALLLGQLGGQLSLEPFDVLVAPGHVTRAAETITSRMRDAGRKLLSDTPEVLEIYRQLLCDDPATALVPELQHERLQAARTVAGAPLA